MPWNPYGLGDTGVPVHIDTGIEDVARPAGGSELEQAARNLYVTRGLLKKFGNTQGGSGCNALKYGTKQEEHSHDCRKRIAQRLQESEAGRGKNRGDGLAIRDRRLGFPAGSSAAPGAGREAA